MLKPSLFLVLSLILCLPALAGIDTAYYKQLNDSVRRATHEEFRDPQESPLDPEDLEDFDSLSYFPFDPGYVVEATFTRTPFELPFKMKTSTDREPEYVKYGTLTFVIDTDTLTLSIYRNLGLFNKPGYRDYYFLPFTDSTNGVSTYGGGRYLDIRIPTVQDPETIILDFNRCYNPYCAYGSRWSCPIPPQENRLSIPINAGVKAWKHR